MKGLKQLQSRNDVEMENPEEDIKKRHEMMAEGEKGSRKERLGKEDG